MGGISFGSGAGEVSKKVVRWREDDPMPPPPTPHPPPLWEILLTVESTIILATITHKYPFIG